MPPRPPRVHARALRRRAALARCGACRVRRVGQPVGQPCLPSGTRVDADRVIYSVTCAAYTATLACRRPALVVATGVRILALIALRELIIAEKAPHSRRSRAASSVRALISASSARASAAAAVRCKSSASGCGCAAQAPVCACPEVRRWRWMRSSVQRPR
jgi:hypothetical protein